MSEKINVGLWLPPRENLQSPITLENPAHIDSRIYRGFLEFLGENKISYKDNLDFRKAIIKNHRVFIGDLCLSDLEHFVWMGMLDRSRDSYHLEVLRVLEFSVRVHNSHTFYSCATDKFSAFSILHKHKIPVAEMYLVSLDNLHDLEPLFARNAFVLKPRRSAFGQGVIKLDSYEQFRDIAEYQKKKDFYLEKFYENDLNHWIGLTVVNGRVLYGFRKKSSKISDWKIYDKKNLGGETIYVKPTAELESIALEIGRILGGNYFGLDFIKTPTGYKLVDINCSPGIYYEFIKELDIPVARMFFQMLHPF